MGLDKFLLKKLSVEVSFSGVRNHLLFQLIPMFYGLPTHLKKPKDW